MEVRKYCFAGLEMQLSTEGDLLDRDQDNLSVFAVENVKEPHHFKIQKVETFQDPPEEYVTMQPTFRVYRDGYREIRYIGSVSQDWKSAYIRVVHDEKEHLVQFRADIIKDKIGTHSILEAFSAEHLIVQNGGFILHCSYIAYNGKAILFTAPSGTGKSTQADLWNQYHGAEIINGDRAALRFINGILSAEGIPYSGSSKHCKNRTLPVQAIVYLSQAPETSIKRLSGYQAFLKVWEGISVNTWNKDDVDKASELVQRIIECTPILHLSCTPDESAVLALQKALEGVV